MGQTGQNAVQSVVRAMRLMKLLARTDDGQRVSDLARTAGLAVSTTHRLLTTLEAEGFAQFDPDQALWHIGRDAFSVGSAYIQKHNFIVPALPYLRQLRDTTRETANLGYLDQDQLVTVSQVESREIVRAISPPGGRVPAFCSGMGKAILATWPDAQIERFARRNGFHPMTAQSHHDLAHAMADIETIRVNGYAVDHEEHVLGLRCVAAVVWSGTGDAVCAISVSGLSARMGAARIAVVGPQVRMAADQLTRQLGGIAP
ncbi:IclR family transcriptional regulator [Rhodobacteraceae bacterium]|nr:IclR family transcriptional regulator [Paracoccaceae bacterium]